MIFKATELAVGRQKKRVTQLTIYVRSITIGDANSRMARAMNILLAAADSLSNMGDDSTPGVGETNSLDNLTSDYQAEDPDHALHPPSDRTHGPERADS